MAMIIGIGGEFESGKDAAAVVLVEEFHFSRMKFADSLRIECWQALMSKDYPPEAPEDILLIIAQNTDPDLVYVKPTTPEMRRFLQWHGTEYRRNGDRDYWVKAAERSIAGDRIVFTDVRFQNEADMIRRHGGLLWKVHRPGTRNSRFAMHASEQWVREYKSWDAVIVNSGTLDELHCKVRDLARCQQQIREAREQLSNTGMTKTEQQLTRMWEMDWMVEEVMIKNEIASHGR